MKKRILDHSRIRSIQGGFAFIQHRFLTDGFLKRLQPPELLLYLFLILVSDAHGLSYYSDKTISRLLKLPLISLNDLRQSLTDQNLITYDPPFVPGSGTSEHPDEKQRNIRSDLVYSIIFC